MAWRLRTGLLVVVLILLSGCTSCKAPFLPTDIPLDAPDTGGRGSRALTVRAVGEEGRAMEFSAYFFWERNARADRDHVVIQALGLRTHDGEITARVPGDRDVGVVVGDVPGYNEQWLLFPPGDLPGGHADVRLYKSDLNGTVSYKWGPAAVSLWQAAGPFYADIEWDPHLLTLHPDEEIAKGYLARITRLNATLTWTNGPTETASLGLVLARAPKDSGNCHYQDQDNEVLPGKHDERYDSSVPSQGFLCLSPFNMTDVKQLYIGAGTDQHLVAPLGLAYQITYEAEFERRPELQQLCAKYADTELKVEKVDPRSGGVTNESGYDADVDRTVPGFDGFGAIVGLGLVVAFLGRRLRRS